MGNMYVLRALFPRRQVGACVLIYESPLLPCALLVPDATCMAIVYPVGFPLFLLCLLLPQRARIRALTEEIERQSAIAKRSMALADLQGVDRDSNFEETKLAVKFRRGRYSPQPLAVTRTGV